MNSGRPDRLAAFHAGLADVLGKLDRVDEARREYDVAIQLGTDQDRRVLSGASPPSGPTPKPSAIRITRRQRANPWPCRNGGDVMNRTVQALAVF